MKTFFKALYYVCIGFLGITTVLLVISIFPITGNFQVKIVQSGSMQPAIKTGSIIISRPAEDYKIGDIITFQLAGSRESVTHRIADIKIEGGEPKYITKGDANNAPDLKEVPKSRVIGKVLFSFPYLGYIVSFTQKPIGFILVIVIPAVVIIGDEVKNIYVEIRNKKKTEE